MTLSAMPSSELTTSAKNLKRNVLYDISHDMGFTKDRGIS